MRASDNVQASGRTLQEEVAAIGTSLLPRIQESQSNQTTQFHSSDSRQNGQSGAQPLAFQTSSQHVTSSGTNGSEQQVLTSSHMSVKNDSTSLWYPEQCSFGISIELQTGTALA